MNIHQARIQTHASGGSIVFAALIGGLGTGAGLAFLLWHLV